MYELFNFEYAIKIIQCRQVSQSDYSKPDYNVVGAVHYRRAFPKLCVTAYNPM